MLAYRLGSYWIWMPGSSAMLPLNSGFYGPGSITMIVLRGSDDDHILVMFICTVRKKQEKVMGSIPVGRSHLTIIFTPVPVSSVSFPSDWVVRRETYPTELEPTSGAYTKFCI
jgi:hypothetical protein